MNFNKNFPSFTLIELLIVIAIIGILAGVVLAVIDPATQRRRSRHGVMQANLSKVCLALVACKSSNTSFDAVNCNSFSKIGAVQPTLPVGAYYTVTAGPSNQTAASGYNWADARMNMGTPDACRMICLVFNDFRAWNGTKPGQMYVNYGTTGCLVQ